MSGSFTDISPERVDRLIGAHPLCWIVPHGAPQAAMLMPVIRDKAAERFLLLGHLPKVSPATKVLNNDPRATFMFLGPNRYISPAMSGIDDWAPTWNFVSLKLSARLAFDEAVTRRSIEEMVLHMEGPQGWTTAKLGHRIDKLLARIIGFIAEIDEVRPRFKLGQDESSSVQASILEALQDDPLVDWVSSR